LTSRLRKNALKEKIKNFSMADKWKKYKEYIVSVLFFVVLILVYIFIVRPLAAKIGENTDEIQKKIADRTVYEEKTKNLTKIKEQAEIYRKNEDYVKNVLARQDQVVELVEELEKLAKDTGNEIKIEINEEKKEKDKKAKKDEESIKLPSENYLQMKILVYGKYRDIFNFIKKLENINFWNDIISLNITKRETSQFSRPDNVSIFENPGGINPSNEQASKNVTAVMEAVFYLE